MNSMFPRGPAIGLALWLLATTCLGAPTQPAQRTSRALFELEEAYADFNDAYGAVSLIDSNPQAFPDQSYAGRTRALWLQLYVQRRVELLGMLDTVPGEGLSAKEARATKLISAAVADSSATPESLAPEGHCADASGNLPLKPLQKALYACFAELANSLRFEDGEITRVAAFDLLTTLPEERRREALFRAFQPLWQALNAHNETSSPYRRMIRLAAAQASKTDSPIEAAARTVGVPSAETERWLERILDTWREVSGPDPIEPWNYRYVNGVAERQLESSIPREALQPLSQRYYADLGLDLAASKVIYDLAPRAGKAPLAYTDYVRRGRVVRGEWQPTIVRVSASYGRGGLGLLNELVHENGHAVHMLALRTRPAFMDLGDPIFYEAFADVPSWNVYEPEWQRKYLGKSVSEADAMRDLYAGVMLDVAWALFDQRMLRAPDSDPNAVWTEITSRYLHVKPHPELAWWAVRVQLVDMPGYMVNYGLGAVITADIRHRIQERLGTFAAGDPRWFGWLSAHLLASGEEYETAQLLRKFLGRPVSPEALLAQLHRVAPQRAAD